MKYTNYKLRISKSISSSESTIQFRMIRVDSFLNLFNSNLIESKSASIVSTLNL